MSQIINVGTAPNDGTGDLLRDAFIIVNENFAEIDVRGLQEILDIDNTSTKGIEIEETDGVAIKGSSDNNFGVEGYSTTESGVYGSSNSGIGIQGYSESGVAIVSNIGALNINDIHQYVKNGLTQASITHNGILNAKGATFTGSVEIPNGESINEAVNLGQLNDAILGGTQCIVVNSYGTPTENGAALQAAYDEAKLRTPSATNPITIIATPGTYMFVSSGFVMDTEYINLVSLDGNRSVIINVDLDGGDPFYGDAYSTTTPCITITADHVFLKGIEGALKYSLEYSFVSGTTDYVLPIDILDVAGSFSSIVIENCKGGIYSFGGHADFNSSQYGYSVGTYINCEGGPSSFGYYQTSGTYIKCKGGIGSFGFYDTSGYFEDCQGDYGSFGIGGFVSGLFVRCQGGNDCFGATEGGEAGGTFKDCSSGNNSFGYIASGVFRNCVANDNSFGFTDASGFFENCQGQNFSFGGSQYGGTEASGDFTNCTGGHYSFGGTGVASGTFTNCKANSCSFGGVFVDVDDIAYLGFATGMFINCTGSNNCYENPVGTFIDCQGGENCFGYDVLGYTSSNVGTFIRCKAGNRSFGAFGNVYGYYESCEGGSSCFGGGEPDGEGDGIAAGSDIEGTFFNCKAATYSFGGSFSSDYASASVNGLFVNCEGGDFSFGGYAPVYGVFRRCKGGDFSFGSVIGSANGTFIDCEGGVYSFGGGEAAGYFFNCRASDFSFGITGYGFAISSGTFINCNSGEYSFGNLSSGLFINCKGLNYSFGGSGGYADGTFSGEASGIFHNCIGGLNSFGTFDGSVGGITATARLYYCRKTSGTFLTVDAGGRTIYCIDGNNNTNNQ